MTVFEVQGKETVKTTSSAFETPQDLNYKNIVPCIHIA